MPVFQRTPGVLHETLDEQTMLIDAEGTELITLNRVGSLVWGKLDGHCGASAIADELARQFPSIERERLRDDIEAFLEELERENLIVAVDQAEGDAGQGS
jgi:hypothetical protein